MFSPWLGRASRLAALGALAAIAASGCRSTTPHVAAAPHVTARSAAPAATPTGPPTASPSPSPAGVRPASPRPFRWHSGPVTAAQLGKSWRAGCPVGPSSLRAVTVTFWGFDRRAHTGTLVVRTRVVDTIVRVFRDIYAARFPIRRMVPIAAYGGDDNASMAADNTSAFNCRYAVANGPKQWSMHAYGEAVDINAMENPYTLDGRIYPPDGKPYTDRSTPRPGMVLPGSAPVRAFTSVGWGWGGRWSSSPDYQHFSTTGQ